MVKATLPGIGFAGLLVLGLLIIWTPSASALDTQSICAPTVEDVLGPFYKPGAPLRQSVGKGYVLEGTARSSSDCASLPGAMIEFWLVGPQGDYGDEYRATVKARPEGSYRFESHRPRPYEGRPPHIHIRVTAPGHRTLVTQHYPEEGKDRAVFDLVLVPSR